MSRLRKVLRATGTAQLAVNGQGDQVRLTTVIPMRIVRHRFSKVIVRPSDVENSEGQRNRQGGHGRPLDQG